MTFSQTQLPLQISLLILAYMFRFTRNHHQALSKDTQIHYIKLLKHVLGSQPFTITFVYGTHIFVINNKDMCTIFVVNNKDM